MKHSFNIGDRVRIHKDKWGHQYTTHVDAARRMGGLKYYPVNQEDAQVYNGTTQEADIIGVTEQYPENGIWIYGVELRINGKVHHTIMGQDSLTLIQRVPLVSLDEGLFEI